MSARNEMLDLLQSRKKFYSLPQALYGDPGYFALELDGVFKTSWLFAGVAAEIPEPGDFFTVAIGKTSVLVLRDRQRQVRAFHNTCRHRGSLLCDEVKGHLSSVVCPYHLWTYDLAGKLRSAGRMHQEFDDREHDLLPVHLESIEGSIYICLADTPPDIAPYKTLLTEFLDGYELGSAKLAHAVHVPVRGNWKLTVENSRECYHCPVGHRTLARSFITNFGSRGIDGIEGIEALWERCEAAGVSSGDSGRGAHPNFRITRFPLLDGSRSITMDGKPAVAKRFGRVPEGDFGSVAFGHNPTTFNHVLADYSFHARMLPVSPEELLLSGYWLVPADAVEGRDYDLQKLIEVWDVTNLEDRDLIERNQKGVNSLGYRPGPYSQESELGVINFVEWYCATMTEFLGGPSRKVQRVA